MGALIDRIHAMSVPNKTRTYSAAPSEPKKDKTPSPGSLAPGTPQPGSYLQKAPDEIYNPAQIASMKARATLSATRGANAGVAGAARMGMDNPAYALLAQRARSGATVQASNAGRDIDTTAREANAGLMLDKERLAQSAGGLGIQSDANKRDSEMAAIMRQLQQLQLASATRSNTAEQEAFDARPPASAGGENPNAGFGWSASNRGRSGLGSRAGGGFPASGYYAGGGRGAGNSRAYGY